MPKVLDEKGFVFVGNDGNAYRCAMWGKQPWLFRWRDGEKRWESIQQLTQMDVWLLPHNLTLDQQEWYFKTEAETLVELLPDNKSSQDSG